MHAALSVNIQTRKRISATGAFTALMYLICFVNLGYAVAAQNYLDRPCSSPGYFKS